MSQTGFFHTLIKGSELVFQSVITDMGIPKPSGIKRDRTKALLIKMLYVCACVCMCFRVDHGGKSTDKTSQAPGFNYLI